MTGWVVAHTSLIYSLQPQLLEAYLIEMMKLVLPLALASGC